MTMQEAIKSPVMIYEPERPRGYRVTWYGGESTYLHFERYRYPQDDWYEESVQSLCMNFPTGVKELYQAMLEFYDASILEEMEKFARRT
jgi:hypothetical protein